MAKAKEERSYNVKGEYPMRSHPVSLCKGFPCTGRTLAFKRHVQYAKCPLKVDSQPVSFLNIFSFFTIHRFSLSHSIIVFAMQLSGTLSTYNPQTRLTMFESGPQNSRGSVVFVAGLMDGYNALPYLPLLGKYLEEQLGFSLIQVMLTSSHMGYGISSLQEDVRELDILFTFLREERAKTRLFFIGHSTGCQDAISFASHGRNRAVIQGIVLQGPVSDREFMMSSLDDMYGKYVRLAQRMINDGKVPMTRPINHAGMLYSPDAALQTNSSVSL